MPGFDGTGPIGGGSMTGRGGGYCLSYVGPDSRFNQRFCTGGGRGRRHWYHATGLPRWARRAPNSMMAAPEYAPPLNTEQELNFLKGQAEHLENTLEQTKNQIKELENKD